MADIKKQEYLEEIKQIEQKIQEKRDKFDQDIENGKIKVDMYIVDKYINEVFLMQAEINGLRYAINDT